MEYGLAVSHRLRLTSVAAPAAAHLLLRHRIAVSAAEHLLLRRRVAVSAVATTTTTTLRLPRHLPTLTAADSTPPISRSMLGRQWRPLLSPSPSLSASFRPDPHPSSGRRGGSAQLGPRQTGSGRSGLWRGGWGI
ncbi:hypothetical protein GUJ93_ZPchr0013g35454 [Zizania palustris]|uniref:Uncharacterized protein n=1 Tax=Zizania palustris TaxID=103762 RepID=A0A8J6BYQ7_ZIZPA|nr:hypothetical protein GUJ93_ZPchr0013g35454 [Zizania palustris]